MSSWTIPYITQRLPLLLGDTLSPPGPWQFEQTVVASRIAAASAGAVGGEADALNPSRAMPSNARPVVVMESGMVAVSVG